MFAAYDETMCFIASRYDSVREAMSADGAAYVQVPHSCTGYGASPIEYSNDACIREDFPGVIPGSWDRGALAPVAMLTDEDGEASYLHEVIERMGTDYPIYASDDWSRRDSEGQMEHLTYCDPDVTEAQWLAAAEATDWQYWPEHDGEMYWHISDEDYAKLRAAVK